ncbi:MAG: biopolymer transporter ExbD [Opitutales bacterium]
MEQWKPDDTDGGFEMTSMIDVVFLLIAFFMTVASFASAELIEMEIPQAPAAKVPENTENRQFISIDIEGTYYYGAAPMKLDEIELYLNERTNNPDFKGVYIRADMQTPHKFVNDLMETCAKAGAFTVIFGTAQD